MRFFFTWVVFFMPLFAQVDGVLKTLESANTKSAASQQNIDAYAKQSEAMFEEYEQIKKELEEQRTYNRRLEMIVDTQKQELPKLQEQLKTIETTQKKIIPLLFDMVETFEKLVTLDTPFLQEERAKRAENLKSYMANPDISLSEQFRMALQSYKIEYGYARTLEAYRSQLDGKNVDFILVGRVGLYYQTLDLQECGIYDASSKSWVKLESSYNEHITKAIKMARKKIAPDFLTIPIIKGTL